MHPPQEVLKQMIELEEDHFDKQRAKKENKIKKQILKEVTAAEHRLVPLTHDIRALEQYIKQLHGQGKKLRIMYYSWLLNRKKRKLEYLKQITPTEKIAKEMLE